MDSFLENIVSSSPVVLVDFFADWCDPCKWVVPILADVEKHFNGKIKLDKIDIDAHVEIARSLHILSVPTLILFVEGKEIWRMRGFDNAKALIRVFEKYVL